MAHRLQKSIDFMIGIGFTDRETTKLLRELGHAAQVVDGVIMTETELSELPRPNTIEEIGAVIMALRSSQPIICAEWCEGYLECRDDVEKILTKAKAGELERIE